MARQDFREMLKQELEAIKEKQFGGFKRIWFGDYILIALTSSGFMVKEGKEKGVHLTGPFIRVLDEKHIAICAHLSEEREGRNVKIPITNEEGREIGKELQIIVNLDKIEKSEDKEIKELEEKISTAVISIIIKNSRLLDGSEILGIGDRYILLKSLFPRELGELAKPKNKKTGEISPEEDVTVYLKDQIITLEDLSKIGLAYFVQVNPEFKLIGVAWTLPKPFPLVFLLTVDAIERTFGSLFKELLENLEEKGFITIKPPLTEWE